ncbi:hypothetical protein HMPREF1544_04518 [Mucor circinelloides 1006PhL]|uniref:Uncharacterized protein n=1 Tax=Mucor circinelloides f. circinelloides (strain 1006PhL) TaxID=1220926 RepID=S2JEC1_MUCC1|nr:hypothetical protein HMPREF1544_04518 [Mucor circinelloides 1006PhL]
MESWKWALIGAGIAVFVVINVTVIYCLYNRRNTETINVSSKEEQSVDSTTIDEGVVANDPKQPDVDIAIQQQEYVTAVQTALSPPRSHHIIAKDKILTTPTKSIHEGKEQQELRVFSLSPLHMQTSEARPSEKTNSICSTSTTTDRSMTPFPNTPTINSIWRGPTPPWTQHPNRYRNSAEMNKQKNVD